MPTYVTPKINTEYIFYTSLVAQSDTKTFQSNPTLAAGDVKVSTDGGAEANITTLPVVTPASSKRVKVTVSAAEMNGDNVSITFSDAAGSEWCDQTINIQTSANQIDDIHSDTTIIASDLVIVGSDAAAIHSQTTVIESDSITIQSSLVVVESQTTVIESNTEAIHSQTTVIESDSITVQSSLVVVESQTTVIESNTEAIHSQTTVIESDSITVQSSLVVVESQTTVIESNTEAIHSQTTVIESDTTVIEANAPASRIAVAVTFTGDTTTTAVLGNVDGSAASSVDDYYNGRILVFDSGTLANQATDITDYTGSTKTATITAVTTAVTGTHTAILV